MGATNYIERVDKAFRREGRVGPSVKVEYPDRTQMIELFNHALAKIDVTYEYAEQLKAQQRAPGAVEGEAKVQASQHAELMQELVTELAKIRGANADIIVHIVSTARSEAAAQAIDTQLKALGESDPLDEVAMSGRAQQSSRALVTADLLKQVVADYVHNKQTEQAMSSSGAVPGQGALTRLFETLSGSSLNS